jgi:hypothetical protein
MINNGVVNGSLGHTDPQVLTRWAINLTRWAINLTRWAINQWPIVGVAPRYRLGGMPRPTLSYSAATATAFSMVTHAESGLKWLCWRI